MRATLEQPRAAIEQPQPLRWQYEPLPLPRGLFNRVAVGEQTPAVPLEGQTREGHWDAETRRAHLEKVTARGFSEQQHAEIIEDIVAIGLPVNNVKALTRRRNMPGTATEAAMGSWGIAEHNKGEFSVYTLLDRLPPQRRLDTLVHEGTHGNSAFNPENAALYGSEEGRREAMNFAAKVAEQTLLTQKYLNGYHHYLAMQYTTGEINREIFAEETQAIVAQMGLTNRKHLEQVQEAQRNEIEKGQANGSISPDVRFTELVTTSGTAGESTVATGPVYGPAIGPEEEYAFEELSDDEADDPVGAIEKLEAANQEPKGVDRILIKLLDGVNNYGQLLQHSRDLKERFRSRVPEVPPQEAVTPHGQIIIFMPPREWGPFGMFELDDDELERLRNPFSMFEAFSRPLRALAELALEAEMPSSRLRLRLIA